LRPVGDDPYTRLGYRLGATCAAAVARCLAGAGGANHHEEENRSMSTLKGFKSFLMQGDLIIIAVGLVIALAFSTLIKAFTDNVITPLINAAGGGGTTGLGVHVKGQLINFGAVISAIIYFIVFMAVIYFAIVVPYRAYQGRRGVTVFGEPPPSKSCPQCLSDGLPTAASRCKFCGAEIAVA
jgi:large conductance mechanosensitive channel